jgi:hypothetical protein
MLTITGTMAGDAACVHLSLDHYHTSSTSYDTVTLSFLAALESLHTH